LRRRFFVDKFANGVARIEGEAAHHLSRVLRAKPGQIYELSDGQTIYLATIARADRDLVEFVLGDQVTTSSPSKLHIGLLIAVVKFDHFEWALEKATELGASAIRPLAAERSEPGLIAAAPKRAERWRKILLESAQQARRLTPPELQPITRATEAFRDCSAGIRILLSERRDAHPLRDVLSEHVDSQAKEAEKSANRTDMQAAEPLAARIFLAVGPEGGWTDGEFLAARAAGFTEASMGVNILRTETAVIAGLAAVSIYCA
jgi:16S rRNA (uracil1498-N3)-methyltransferase